MKKGQLILPPLVALIAVVGVVISVIAVTKNPPSTQPMSAQIHHDQTEIAGLREEVGVLQAASTNAATVGNLTKLQGNVSSINSTLHKYAVCVPQMMNYINRIQADASWVQDVNGNKLITYPLSVSSNVQISSDCGSLLYGSHGV